MATVETLNEQKLRISAERLSLRPASLLAYLLERGRELGPPLLGLVEEAGLLVALGAGLEHERKLSSILVLISSHRQLSDADGAVQKREALAKAASHLAVCPGEVEEVYGNFKVEGPVLGAGRPAEAVPLIQRSIAFTERKHGPFHCDIPGDLVYLAKAYGQTGRGFGERLSLLDRAISIRELSVGSDKVQDAGRIGVVLQACAKCYEEAGLLEEA